MQSIQRALMLLKSDTHPGCNATLKLQAQNSGVDVNLSVQGLPEGVFFLYLFDTNQNEHCIGQITGDHFHTVLDRPLSDIAKAAIINQSTGGFILKSSGTDWHDAMTRFRLSRIQAQPDAKSQREQSAQASPDTQEPAQTQASAIGEDESAFSTQQKEEDLRDDRTSRFDAQDNTDICSTCPHVIRQDKINPFPSAFPQSEWVKISYPGPAGWWHYISGKIYRDKSLVAKVLGVPGEYGMAPPIWLEGFGTYMRCATPDAHGYWLMFQDAQTGEVLDMALSPHDA